MNPHSLLPKRSARRPRAVLSMLCVGTLLAVVVPASAAETPARAGNASPASVPLFLLPFVVIASNLQPVEPTRALRTRTRRIEREDSTEVGFSAPAFQRSSFDEMLGSHRIQWRHGDDWTTSLGSDYPRVGSSPSYVLGNGAPGVPQKVWIRFSIQRHF